MLVYIHIYIYKSIHCLIIPESVNKSEKKKKLVQIKTDLKKIKNIKTDLEE